MTSSVQEFKKVVLAQNISKRARLRSIAEESPFDYLIHGSRNSIYDSVIRIIFFISIGTIIISSYFGAQDPTWPVITIIACLYAYRSNKRLDALLAMYAVDEELEEDTLGLGLFVPQSQKIQGEQDAPRNR
jgi:hypothetical protein